MVAISLGIQVVLLLIPMRGLLLLTIHLIEFKYFLTNSIFCSSHGEKNGEFASPVDVTTDTFGRIIVADYKNYRIQIFTEILVCSEELNHFNSLVCSSWEMC